MRILSAMATMIVPFRNMLESVLMKQPLNVQQMVSTRVLANSSQCKKTNIASFILAVSFEMNKTCHLEISTGIIFKHPQCIPIILSTDTTLLLDHIWHQ